MKNTRTILLLLSLNLLAQMGSAQNPPRRPAALSEQLSKGGAMMLRALAPVAEAARQSVVRLEMEGKTLVLGVVVGVNGLALTKASELKEGALTCKLADGQEVEAAVIAVDEDNDLALIKTGAACLRPIVWTRADATPGQWAVTQGTGLLPESIGIVSAPARKILHARAFMGVTLTNAPVGQIVEVIPESGAAKAGLKPGDIVLKVNGATVKSTEALRQTLSQFRDGQQVKLRVQREAEQFDAQVRLAARIAWPAARQPNRQRFLNRLVGPVSRRAEDFDLAFQHDSVLQPWQCGGPLLNLEAEAIGLNIARAGRTASYALPASLVLSVIDTLKLRATQSAPPESDTSAK